MLLTLAISVLMVGELNGWWQLTPLPGDRQAEIAASMVMATPASSARVRNGLLGLKGVLCADVYLPNGVAAVAYDPRLVTTAGLITAVYESGSDGRHEYRAHVLQTMPARDVFTAAD